MSEMNRRIWPLALVVLAAPMTGALAETPSLICFGTEPFWSLDLTSARKGRFSTPDSPEVEYSGGFHPLAHRKESVWRGEPTASEGGDLVAFLREGRCSDGMSDRVYPYSVNISLPGGHHLAGCCRLTDAPAVLAGLENGTWRLTQLSGQPLSADRGAPMVTFEAGRVHGFSGCNRFMGAYSLEGDRLGTRALGGTMMACPEPAMSVERQFLASFSGPSQVELVGDVLTLIPAKEGGALRFERVAPASLEGVDWEVTGYNNGRQAVVSPEAGTRLTLRFADGRVSGSGGCNRFDGSFTADGESLRIQPLVTTRKLCADPVMAQERAFLDALGSATTWRIERGMLDVHRADGERVLTATELGRE